MKEGFERVEVFADRTVHSFKKPSGHTTHVTMFPARSTHKHPRKVLPPEKYFARERELKEKVRAMDAEFNPYVFMTGYKLKHEFPQVVVGGRRAMRVDKEFSLYNAKFVYPFEPTPNPFRLDKM